MKRYVNLGGAISHWRGWSSLAIIQPSTLHYLLCVYVYFTVAQNALRLVLYYSCHLGNKVVLPHKPFQFSLWRRLYGLEIWFSEIQQKVGRKPVTVSVAVRCFSNSTPVIRQVCDGVMVNRTINTNIGVYIVLHAFWVCKLVLNGLSDSSCSEHSIFLLETYWVSFWVWVKV